MSLERVLYWVDAGTTKYTGMYAMQQRIAALRETKAIGDIIIATQHLPEVNFGSDKDNNQFSKALLKETCRRKGREYTKEDIIGTLRAKGIEFSETTRGGGATVVAPGQYIFYPIVDHKALTNGKTDVTAYKRLIDQILYNVIKQWNVPNLGIAQGTITTAQGTRERRDVWTTVDGKSYKIGSKGVQLGKTATQGGFVIYAEKTGVDPFKWVHACGYRPEEVGVISIEETTGKKPDREVIRKQVQEEVMRIFNYTHLVPLRLDEIAKQEEIHAATQYR